MPIVPSKQVGSNTATEPLITNYSIASANTEYSHVLNDGVKQIIMRCRESARIQYCFVYGESNSNYMTIRKNCVVGIDKIKFTGKTIYFQSGSAPVTLEILELI